MGHLDKSLSSDKEEGKVGMTLNRIELIIVQIRCLYLSEIALLREVGAGSGELFLIVRFPLAGYILQSLFNRCKVFVLEVATWICMGYICITTVLIQQSIPIFGPLSLCQILTQFKFLNQTFEQHDALQSFSFMLVYNKTFDPLLLVSEDLYCLQLPSTFLKSNTSHMLINIAFMDNSHEIKYLSEILVKDTTQHRHFEFSLGTLPQQQFELIVEVIESGRWEPILKIFFHLLTEIQQLVVNGQFLMCQISNYTSLQKKDSCFLNSNLQLIPMYLLFLVCPIGGDKSMLEVIHLFELFGFGLLYNLIVSFLQFLPQFRVGIVMMLIQLLQRGKDPLVILYQKTYNYTTSHRQFTQFILQPNKLLETITKAKPHFRQNQQNLTPHLIQLSQSLTPQQYTLSIKLPQIFIFQLEYSQLPYRLSHSINNILTHSIGPITLTQHPTSKPLPFLPTCIAQMRKLPLPLHQSHLKSEQEVVPLLSSNNSQTLFSNPPLLPSTSLSLSLLPKLQVLMNYQNQQICHQKPD